MPKELKSITRVRLGVAAALGVVGLALSLLMPPTTYAYPAAQAEAQSDPGQDPYGFPNVQLCCEKRTARRSYRTGHSGYYWKDKWRPDTVTVNCGAPTEDRRVFGSIRDALDHVTVGGRVQIIPGAACDISGLHINRSVRLETSGYGYGSRAKLVGGPCAYVSGANGPVAISGVDIEACLTLQSGQLDLDEVNLAWRGQGPAIEVNGGVFRAARSTVRAREMALSAPSGARVILENSRFATTFEGRHVIRLSVESVLMSDVLVKGARTGLMIDRVGSSVDLNNVTVVRGEQDDPYPASDSGDYGILIGDAAPSQDLPWLSGTESRRVAVRGGLVGGYKSGISLSASTSGVIEGVVINDAAYGISVGRGSFVKLNGNRINRSKSVGINLEAGARGSADRNTIQCTHGDCVCYGGHCTSRSSYVFGSGLFRMTDTDCDD